MSDSVSLPTAPPGIEKRTVRGAVALGIRQVLVQGTRILGGIFLARLLSPAQFGVYAIVLYLQSFLTAFGDAGLAASLIRQQEEPEQADFRAIFTIQQILVFAIAFGMWVLSPWIASRYHLPPHSAWLFRLTALSFVVTSLMVIPLVRLERRLAFDRVAIVESAQAVVFNVFAVYFAWRGMGSFAFVDALLLRAITGAVLANWMSPWKIGWLWDWPLIRSHMAFGLPYQGIQVTSLLKDSITPIFIGIFLGTTDVGFITWAMMIAAYPVLILFVLQRLYMPAFARLQNNKGQLRDLVENVIWATNAIAAPLAVLTLATITPITVTIYGAKWLAGLPYFYFFWLANLFVPTATPVAGLLNALGKSKIALLFAFIWMAGTWLIGAPLILVYGAIGIAMATFLIQFTNFWLYRAAQKRVQFRLYPVVAPPWAIACIPGVLVYLAGRIYAPHSIVTLGTYGITGLLGYAAGMYLFYKQKFHAVWLSLRGAE